MAFDKTVQDHVVKHKGGDAPMLQEYEISYKFCEWFRGSFMRKVFIEGCLHASLHAYGFGPRVQLRVTTNAHEALNRSLKHWFMAITGIFQKRGICLNSFQCYSVRWYTKFYGCMKAALGGFAPSQWGGLVSGDCIIPAGASNERIGRVIDLRKITTISQKGWCLTDADTSAGLSRLNSVSVVF